MKFEWKQLILTLELTRVQRCNEGEKTTQHFKSNSAAETASSFKATIPHKIL